MLHASAGAALVGSGAVALLTPRAAPPPELVAEMQVLDVVVAMPTVAALPVVVRTPVATPVVVAAATPTEVAAATLAVRKYVVEPGDSVRTIAHQFNVTNETVIWENDLTDPDVLQVGQELEILPFSGLIHEVRPGDTLASVANSYEALIHDVISANSLTEPYVIVVGQKLLVPGGYRPLPQKVVVGPSSPGDTVQAPPGDGDQQAAIVRPRRVFPVLGGTPQESFIASIAEAAVESADDTGVPASVTIAQAILESYWGSSRLAHEANNFFGIKAQTRGGSAGSVWFDVWEVIGGRNIMQAQAFRAYNTIAESFVDHGRFFTENARYGRAMAVKDDPRQFAREVNRAGYATDPAYASKLIGLMDRYDLYRYDAI